jgi:hypothetical protein
LSNLRFKIRHSYHLFSKMKELDGHRKTWVDWCLPSKNTTATTLLHISAANLLK